MIKRTRDKLLVEAANLVESHLSDVVLRDAFQGEKLLNYLHDITSALENGFVFHLYNSTITVETNIKRVGNFHCELWHSQIGK